jgi:hypothetical protein
LFDNGAMGFQYMEPVLFENFKNPSSIKGIFRSKNKRSFKIGTISNSRLRFYTTSKSHRYHLKNKRRDPDDVLGSGRNNKTYSIPPIYNLAE